MKREICVEDINKCTHGCKREWILFIRHSLFEVDIGIMGIVNGSIALIPFDCVNEVEYVKVKLASVIGRYRELMSYLMTCSDVNDTDSKSVSISELGDTICDYPIDRGVLKRVQETVSQIDYKQGSETIEVRFISDMSRNNDILRNLVKAHDIRVASEMDDTIDDTSERFGEWLGYMSQFVDGVEEVLRGLYGIYVGMMANQEVAKYVLEHSDDGLVRSVYHSDLGDSVDIKVNIGIDGIRMLDYYVDVLYGYQIDDKGNVRGKTNRSNQIDIQNLGMDGVDGSDDLCRLVNILEMMAYINDKITGYYLHKSWDYFGDIDSDIIVSTSESVRELSQRFMGIANEEDEAMSETIGEKGAICELDDLYYGYGLIIDIKASLLSKKVMASRVFDVVLIEWYYLVLLVAYAKSVFGKDIT